MPTMPHISAASLEDRANKRCFGGDEGLATLAAGSVVGVTFRLAGVGLIVTAAAARTAMH